MKTSKENIYYGSNLCPNRNFSDTNICIQQFSISPEEDQERKDLQIVGLKINFGGEFSRTNHGRSKSLNMLKSVRRRRKNTFDKSFPEIYMNDNAFGMKLSKEAFDNKLTPLQTKNADAEGINTIEQSDVIPEPKFDFTTFGEENTDWICQEQRSTNFNGDCERKENNPTDAEDNNVVQTVPFSNSLDTSATTTEKDDVCSKLTQTIRNVQSLNTQTENALVWHSNNIKDTSVQTESTQEASIDYRMSIGTQTAAIPNREVSVGTGNEIIVGPSRFETEAVLSIDPIHTDGIRKMQLVDVDTMTESDTFILDGGRTSDICVGTEDLCHDNLIVEAKTVASPDCTAHCEQIVNQITDHSTTARTKNMPNFHCSNQHYNPTCKESKSNGINSSLGSFCNSAEIYTTDKDQIALRKTKDLKYSEVVKEKQSSFAESEQISNTSHVEVIKDLEFDIKAMTAMPQKIPIRIEKTLPLEAAAFSYNFTPSCNLPLYGLSPVLITPIDIFISDTENQNNASKISERMKGIKQRISWNELKEKNQILMFCDDTKDESVSMTPMLPLTSVSESTAHPQIGFCSSCYNEVRKVLQEKQESPTEPLGAHNGLKSRQKTKHSLSSDTLPRIRGKNFDYTSKDPWKPFEDSIKKSDEIGCIAHMSNSSREEFMENVTGNELNIACETVNKHLLDKETADIKLVEKSAETLHRIWFEIAATNQSDVQEVARCLKLFKAFSPNLLKTLLYSTDNNDNNVLHFAYANNRFDLVEELLNNEDAVDLLNKTNKAGNSPLMICAISQPKCDSDWFIIRKSFRMGNPNMKSIKGGQTPLMYAASRGFSDMVWLLLDLEADPNLRDVDGSTALMYAAEHGHSECISLLIEHPQCDATINDLDGQTACAIALSGGHQDAAVLIHRKGIEKKNLLNDSCLSKQCTRTNHNTSKLAPSAGQND